MTNLAEMLCDAGRLMFDRGLTDMAGGNISVRDGDVVYMSPRFAGQHYHWDMTPDLIVSGKWADDEITRDPRFSREGWSHLAIYRCFPDVTAVVHAHSFHIMPYCAFSQPIEPVLEGTEKFGVVEVCEPAPAHSKVLADHIVAAMKGKEDRMRKQAAAILIPFHGIILAGKDFLETLDALQRIDENAYCLTVRSQVERKN